MGERAISKERSKHIRGFILFLTFFFALMVISGVTIYRRHKDKEFIYADHLDEVILTVDDEEITLRQFGYYIYEMEGFVQRQALIYDETEPTKYWNLHYSAGMESTFMFDYAMKTALNTCVRDAIYAHMALQGGYRLTKEQEERLDTNARLFWGGMSEAQRNATGLTTDIVLQTEERRLVNSSFLIDYAASHDLSGYGGTPTEVLSSDGAYYRQEILPQHTVIYNEDLIHRIRMGTVTVNRAA